MSSGFRCAAGHHWESSTGERSAAASPPTSCPVCGSLGTPTRAGEIPGASRPGIDDLPPPPHDSAGASTVHTDAGAVAAPALRPALSLPTVPGYEMLGRLGRGGMGVVYQARQHGLNRLVAIKMILRGTDASSEVLTRFRAEGEAVARLRHPHIVQVYDVGVLEGQPFLVLEYLEGGSLDRKLVGTPQPPRAAAELLVPLARALESAHQAAVVHRDLKPANVLLTADGTPKVTDFGLAKFLDAEQQHTPTDAVLGTPSYMAPEQAAGRKSVGPGADIYALGAILYEMLTGRPPFKGQTPMDTMVQVLGDEPVRPRQLQPKVPRDLQTICLKCLEKKPERRYANAAALADDLQRFLGNRPIEARPVNWWERSVKLARRHPVSAALTAATILTLLVLIGGGAWYNVRLQEALAQSDANRDKAVEQEGIAREEANKARQAQKDAETQAGIARQQTTLAQQERDRARHNLYAAHTNLALDRWRDGQMDVALNLLDGPGCRPSRADEPDLRGWEWSYLRSLCDRSLWGDRGGSMSCVRVAFSPDGKQLAAACWDGDVVLWDLEKGGSRRLRGHGAAIHSVAFSPDGSLLASGSVDKTVRIWDRLTGKQLRSLQASQAIVASVAFSPDGRQVAAAEWETALIRLWDIASGREVRAFRGHPHFVGSVAFSPDGKWLASGSQDGSVRLWDAATGQQVAVAAGHRFQVSCVAFSPDSKLLASSSEDETIRVWDVQRQRLRNTFRGPHRWVYGVAFSPDGRTLASGSYDRLVRLWDVRSEREPAVLRGHHWHACGVAFSPDGRFLASCGHDGLVKIWHAVPGPQEYLSVPGHTDMVTWAAFGPDSQQVATSSFDGTVRIWDAGTGQETRLIQHGRWAISVAWSRRGGRLATGGSDGGVRLWNADTGVPLQVLRGHTGEVRIVAFSPDGRRLASGGQDGILRLWAVTDGKLLAASRAHGGTIRSLAFDGEGKLLATGGDDHLVRIWEVETGRQVRELPGHKLPVLGVAFRADGKFVASGSRDKRVLLWDLTTTNPPMDLHAHDDAVATVAFTPDGRRLASGAFDGTVKLWDSSTGLEVLTLKGHNSPLYCVAFSPDGRRLVSVAHRPEFLLWDAMDRSGKLDLSDKAALAWHERQAAECEREQQWQAAVFHIKRLTALRGRELARMVWGNAFAQPWTEPLSMLRSTSLRLGRAHAELEEWGQAEEQFAAAASAGVDEPRLRTVLALVRLARGDPEGYRRTCSELLDRVREGDNPETVAMIAWTCLLGGDAFADKVLPLAEGAAKRSRSSHCRRILGLALDRAGRRGEALENYRKARTDVQHAECYDDLLLALAQYRGGASRESTRVLEEVIRSSEAHTQEEDRSRLGWEQRLALRLLLREAKTALHPPGEP